MTKPINLPINNDDKRNIWLRGLSSVGKVFTWERVLWLGSPVLLLLIWEAISRSGLVLPIILPAPSTVFHTLYNLFASGEILPHIYFSLFRAIVGFICGSALGILLGLIMGWSKIANTVADIPFNIFRAIPKVALVPVFIVWFGIGEFPKILLIALTPFVLCTINTMAGVKSVDATLIKAAWSLGANDRQILREIIVPAATPMIFAALRLGIVLSMVMLVVAEMTAADKGLGTFVVEQQRLFQTDRSFGGVMVLSALAYILDRIVNMIGNRLTKWHKGAAAIKG